MISCSNKLNPCGVEGCLGGTKNSEFCWFTQISHTQPELLLIAFYVVFISGSAKGWVRSLAGTCGPRKLANYEPTGRKCASLQTGVVIILKKQRREESSILPKVWVSGGHRFELECSLLALCFRVLHYTLAVSEWNIALKVWHRALLALDFPSEDFARVFAPPNKLFLCCISKPSSYCTWWLRAQGSNL